MEKILFQDLGLIDYKEAWDYQEEIFKKNIDKKIINRREDKEIESTKHHF